LSDRPTSTVRHALSAVAGCAGVAHGELDVPGRLPWYIRLWYWLTGTSAGDVWAKRFSRERLTFDLAKATTDK
jgi:hypothetical protein